jgi:hypothetical protein
MKFYIGTKWPRKQKNYSPAGERKAAQIVLGRRANQMFVSRCRALDEVKPRQDRVVIARENRRPSSHQSV